MFYVQFYSRYSNNGPITETLGSDCWFPVDGRRTPLVWRQEALERSRWLNKGPWHHRIVAYEVRRAESRPIFRGFSVVVPQQVLP